MLREIILSRESKPSPENLIIDSVLQHRTTNIPPELNEFFQYLGCGSDLGRRKSYAKQRRI